MNASYVLNERFKVIPNTNEIVYLEDKTKTKVEPRIMRLLCLLLAKPNELIERKTIIKDIWENYGGADESLTQAVSHLRKILDTDSTDQNISLIETITKKGYRMNATVNMDDPQNRLTKKYKRHILALYIVIALLLLTILYLLSPLNDPSETPAPDIGTIDAHISPLITAE